MFIWQIRDYTYMYSLSLKVHNRRKPLFVYFYLLTLPACGFQCLNKNVLVYQYSNWILILNWKHVPRAHFIIVNETGILSVTLKILDWCRCKHKLTKIRNNGKTGWFLFFFLSFFFFVFFFVFLLFLFWISIIYNNFQQQYKVKYNLNNSFTQNIKYKLFHADKGILHSPLQSPLNFSSCLPTEGPHLSALRRWNENMYA